MSEIYKVNEKLLEGNKSKIIERFAHIINPLISLHDCQIKLFNNHISIIIDPYYNISTQFKITLQSFFNNSQTLFSALHLTSLGNHGGAKIFLRKIFEFQLLGKFASINKESKILEKWINGSQVDIYKKIIKPLKSPNRENIFKFWKDLCNPVHATIFESQIGYEWEINEDSIEMTLIIIFILNITNYHLLNSHLINSKMRYYSEKYGRKKIENSELKVLSKKAISFAKQHFISKFGRKFITDYNSKWIYNL